MATIPTYKYVNKVESLARATHNDESSTYLQAEKLNLNIKYLAGIGRLLLDRWRLVTFTISSNSMLHYDEKYKILKEVIFEVLAKYPENQERWINQMDLLELKLANCVIKNEEGNPSKFKIEELKKVDREMDLLRVELLQLMERKGLLTFKTSDSRFSMAGFGA